MTVDIRVGDALTELRKMPDESVQCCVTSPPYWGLRDYGMAGQLGLERTPDAYVAAMVGVFSEVRRVLRADGTLWLNVGDTYARKPNGSHGNNTSTLTRPKDGRERRAHQSNPPGLAPDRNFGLRMKSLVGLPWRLAFALQSEGWILRQEIIWHKTAVMPESVRDRPTRTHEQIFLLARSERYYYDADAISEPCSENTHARVSQDVAAQIGSLRANGGSRSDRPMKAVGRKRRDAGEGIKANDDFHDSTALLIDRRNKRSVWTVAPQGFAGAHFATFPQKLIEPCILAGSARGDTVLDPFMGAGTTGLVADRLGRNAIGIELNPEYAKMARRRITDDAPLFADGAA